VADVEDILKSYYCEQILGILALCPIQVAEAGGVKLLHIKELPSGDYNL